MGGTKWTTDEEYGFLTQHLQPYYACRSKGRKRKNTSSRAYLNDLANQFKAKFPERLMKMRGTTEAERHKALKNV
jgi:hypothetical protein